jgi:hypothetical protein
MILGSLLATAGGGPLLLALASEDWVIDSGGEGGDVQQGDDCD